MKTRQLVGNHPAFIKLVTQHCIAVAANDVDYSHAPDDQKTRREFRWLADAMKGAKGIQQGIYLVTPSGQFLQRVDGGWPLYDPEISVKKLREGLEQYQALDRSERSQCPPFAAADRMEFEWQNFAPPADAIDLTVINRSFPYQGADKFDIRHPSYFKTDRLILTREDQLALLPENLVVDATIEVDKNLRDRFLLHNHLAMGHDAWWSEHIKNSSMIAAVTGVKNDIAYVQYAAVWEAKADSKWSTATYTGSMFGKAQVNVSSRTFSALEFVALGEHDVGEMRSNMHRNVTTTPVGMIAVITPPQLTNQPLPSNWAHGYPNSWRK